MLGLEFAEKRTPFASVRSYRYPPDKGAAAMALRQDAALGKLLDRTMDPPEIRTENICQISHRAEPHSGAHVLGGKQIDQGGGNLLGCDIQPIGLGFGMIRSGHR